MIVLVKSQSMCAAIASVATVAALIQSYLRPALLLQESVGLWTKPAFYWKSCDAHAWHWHCSDLSNLLASALRGSTAMFMVMLVSATGALYTIIDAFAGLPCCLPRVLPRHLALRTVPIAFVWHELTPSGEVARSHVIA